MDASRKIERELLFYDAVLLLAGSTMFTLASLPRWDYTLWTGAGILIAMWFLIHLSLPAGHDPYLFPVANCLTVIGLLFLYGINPAVAYRHWQWIVVGLSVASLRVALVQYRRIWFNLPWVWAGISILLLVVTLGWGIKSGGATSWLRLGPVRFQPSELAKILMVFFTASYFSAGRNQYGPWPLWLTWGAFLGLLAIQKDLGTALVFFSGFMTMNYIATQRLRVVGASLVVLALGVLFAYYTFDHFRLRVLAWLHLWDYATSLSYQVVQGLIAMASGSMLGVGLGLGAPRVIPAVTTDYLFAAVGEEWGLFGAVAVIILYALLVWRGYRVGLKAMGQAEVLCSCGLTSVLGFQVLIVLAGICSLLPLTGLPLPFLSYGGTSMVVSYAILGLIVGFSSLSEGTAREGNWSEDNIDGGRAGAGRTGAGNPGEVGDQY